MKYLYKIIDVGKLILFYLMIVLAITAICFYLIYLILKGDEL